MTQELWTVPKVWVKDRVFIIGGGPSLLQTPYLNRVGLSTLRFIKGVRSRVIAINNAYELFPRADVLYFGDVDWTDDNASEIVRRWRGDEIITRVAHNESWGFKSKRLARDMLIGLSRNPSALAGWDSGSNAINLAYLYGAREIVLLGFDMKGDNWHTKHKRPKKDDCYNIDFIPSLQRMAPELAKDGCKVWNASPDSVLDCFERKELQEFFR